MCTWMRRCMYECVGRINWSLCIVVWVMMEQGLAKQLKAFPPSHFATLWMVCRCLLEGSCCKEPHSQARQWWGVPAQNPCTHTRTHTHARTQKDANKKKNKKKQRKHLHHKSTLCSTLMCKSRDPKHTEKRKRIQEHRALCANHQHTIHWTRRRMEALCGKEVTSLYAWCDLLSYNRSCAGRSWYSAM